MISIAPEGGWMFHRQWLFETDQVQVLGVAARFAAPLPIENTTNPEWRGVTNFFLRWEGCDCAYLSTQTIQGTDRIDTTTAVENSLELLSGREGIPVP